MCINEITNFLQVSGQIASSGQPDDHHFKVIANADYKVVINLAMPNSDNAIPDEGNIVTALKMIYIHIPVPFDSPSIDHLRKFINIMSMFSGEKVWVHCVVNYRASAFLYQYHRIVHGETAQEAEKCLFPSWQPDEVWEQFMAISSNEVSL